MFDGWGDFFLLVGTAAGALIGLLFVVVTLTAGRESTSVSRGARVYMTPTVFQFALVVLLSAVALAPRLPLPLVGGIVAAGAAVGLAYAAAIWLQVGGGAAQPAHWTDAWYYGAIPTAVYVMLAAAAASFWLVPPDAPYALACVLLALLALGIRNAWDLVTWLAPHRPELDGRGSSGRTS